ncbi:hypothetical protein K0M31_004100 [Melipona bicolor]|uniref:Uncharacterized protein n=1 Tax=Melipona bicolor TaxID=60889 RepID=A0AA40FY62_9HYME|nr:hypothetical protein K0M31_004100 [Melipona bicolor]
MQGETVPFFSGATEIRVGGSNGGKGESSRTTEKQAQPPRATVARGREKGEWKSRTAERTRVVLPRALANARVIAPRIEPERHARIRGKKSFTAPVTPG